MKYVIGIDGGGTKTLGYIGDMEGRILASTVGGAANYHAIGLWAVEISLTQVITSLCQQIGVDKKEIGIISAGLAGVDRPRDREKIEELFHRADMGCRLIVNNDAKTALVGAHGKEKGAIIISGTGSICYGMDGGGKTIRAGGWGHVLGDEGSGYDIGRRALAAVMRAHDGRERKTVLTGEILNHLQLNSVEDLLLYVYSPQQTKEQIAQLAPVVLKAADALDPVALGIIDRAIEDLAVLAKTVLQQLDGEEKSLAFDGGIFRKSGYMQKRFKEEIHGSMNGVKVDFPMFNGAIGAVLMAWRDLHVTYDIEALRKQIEEVIENDKRNYDSNRTRHGYL